MVRRFPFIWLSLLSCWGALGFTPPLNFLLRSAFEGRRPASNVELVIQHHIQLSGAPVEIDERVLSGRLGTLFAWRSPDSQNPEEASLSHSSYRMNHRQRQSHSSLFLKYLASSSSEPFRDALIQEQFIQSEDLQQYKAGFNPTGDPQTWDLKDNYLIHPDMYLERFSKEIGVAVTGLDSNGESRTILFNRDEPGVRRLEWKDGAQSSTWAFDDIAKLSAGGWFPRRMAFFRGDTASIQSVLISRRPLNDRQALRWKKDWQRAFNSGVPPARMEEALTLLLSER